MKSINQYIQERLFIKKKTYNYFPKTKKELKDLLKQLIEERGNEGDFNDIDTSKITDMSNLFFFEDLEFNGDISSWDVSNVKDMSAMFWKCKNFNQDISRWDVSKVLSKVGIFEDCPIQEKYKPKFK